MKSADARVPQYRPEDAARYRAAGFWGTRTIADELRRAAQATPDASAVVSVEGTLTYRQLDERADRIAAGLHGLGLRPGEPVLFQVNNRYEAILGWYAVLKAGLVPVCTLAQHRKYEIEQISKLTGAVAHLVEAKTPKFDLVEFALDHAREHLTLRHVLAIGDHDENDARARRIETLGADIAPAVARTLVDDIQAQIHAEDVAVFQLSGGTTGVPKLIPRFHAEYWYNAKAWAAALGWDASARVAHLIPIIHNAGIVCALHAAHSVGATVVLGTADMAASAPLLARERVTDILVGHGHYVAAPEVLPSLKGSLKRVILSGAKPSDALFDSVEALGVKVGQLFGMGEGLLTMSRWDAPELARRTTVGTPLSSLDEMKILDPNGLTELPDGTVGELTCKGPYTTPGYFDAQEHNKRAFTPDGFYRTGDLAKIVDIEGTRHLSIEGRIKDLINRGGEKINAEEVELLLGRHPDILEAAVIAMPDERLGERACAYLVSRHEPLSMEQVRQHLETQGLAKFKWPERLEWRKGLPRSNVNKVDKKAMREDIKRLLETEAASR